MFVAAARSAEQLTAVGRVIVLQHNFTLPHTFTTVTNHRLKFKLYKYSVALANGNRNKKAISSYCPGKPVNLVHVRFLKVALVASPTLSLGTVYILLGVGRQVGRVNIIYKYQ